MADGAFEPLDRAWRSRVSTDALAAARRFAAAVGAEPSPGAGDGPGPTALAAAALARLAAPGLCRRDPATGTDCAWYHGLWPSLRALGVVTTPATHAAFFAEVLGARAGEGGAPRVLVSGGADHATAALMLDACRRTGQSADITFVDICETPLLLAAAFAAGVGARLTTVCSDILAFEAEDPFDVVCTHSFLGYFAPPERARLAARWRALLRPGGAVVTIHRVRPGAGVAPVGFGADEARAFETKTRRAAEREGGGLGIGSAALAAAARLYAERFRIHPVASEDALRALFADAGFRVDRLDVRAVPGKARAAAAGPTTPESARYAHVVATRL